MATSTIVLLSDSTNAWFVDTANRQTTMVRELFDRFKVTVKTSECTTLTGAYQALQTTFIGQGSDEILMYDGAVGGSNWDDYDASAIAARITAVSPDIVLIAYGINGGEAGADGIGSLIDDVQAAAPSATILMLSQNPITSHGPTDTNRDFIQAAAVAESLTFVDVYQAFIDTGDYASYLSDGTHPNAAGKALYVDTVAPSLASAISLTPQGAAVGILEDPAIDLLLRASQYSGSGDWLDESGNGYDGSLTGPPSWDGTKFTFDGTSGNLVTVADADELDPDAGGDTWTIVIVCSPATDAGSGSRRLVTKRANGVPWWDVAYTGSNDNISAGISDGTTTRTASATALPGAPTVDKGAISVVSYRHLVDASGQRLGVNGSYGTVGGTLSNPVASATDLTIGGGFFSYWKGDIYGVAIWNKLLSDDEVEEAGTALQLSYNVADAATLHGDSLKTWILENVSSGYTSTEIVGMLNELNGTNGVEYAEARGTFLGVDPAG